MNNDTTAVTFEAPTAEPIEDTPLLDERIDAEQTDEVAEETEEERAEPKAEDIMAAELEALRAQVCELTDMLAKKQQEAEKIAAQLGDFYSLFPDTAVDALPEEVWDDVRKGNSLAASYAVYQRKMQLRAERIQKINQKNATLSAGKAGTDTEKEFYTPDEVRSMSQGQVRANYSKIINSMKKWN